MENMLNVLNKRGMVFAIIGLFIGVSVTPSTSGKIKHTKPNNQIKLVK